MIFSIRRASRHYRTKERKPCAEAVEVMPPDDDNDGLYTIEFKTLDELLAFVQREEKIVIYKNGKHHFFSLDTLYEDAISNMPDGLIMIYDDYLE